jgi:methionyl-tRNA formyltransferase
VLLVAAFGEILKPELLAVPRIGAVNLHASLLPKYRGAAPIQRALLAGVEETGVTAQWMAAGLDTGDVILRRAAAIQPEEDYGSLHDRLAALAAEVATETLDLIRTGEAPRIPQEESAASYAPPIQPGDLVIHWEQPAEGIARQVRAFSPRPGARTAHQGTLLKILAARPAAGAGGIPGEVVEVSGQGLRVQTGSASLIVLRVQPEGRTPMPAGDYARGHHLCLGQVLGSAES